MTSWSEPESFVGYRLLQVAESLSKRFALALEPVGLSPRHFSVLSVLAARPGITSAELARAVFTTPQSMGPLVDQLEARGLVEPRAKLGRGVPAPVTISPAGQRLLAEGRAVVRRLDDETREALGADHDALVRILGLLDELAARPAPT